MEVKQHDQSSEGHTGSTPQFTVRGPRAIIRKVAETVFVCGLILLPVWVLIWAVVIAIRWSDFRGSHLVALEQYATAPGVIISSDIAGRGRRTHYHIAYEFELGGKRYRSRRVSFGYKGGYYYALRYVAKYRVGKPVTVFYDRTQPTFSVLEPNTRSDFLTPLWLPFVPFGLSCTVLLLLPARAGKQGKSLEHERKNLESARKAANEKPNDSR